MSDDDESGTEADDSLDPDEAAKVRAEIRRRRKARRWSAARLAREAGVADRTIRRIENEDDYAGAGSLAKVAAVLGIEGYAADGDPPLSSASPEEIAAHILRVLTEAAENREILEKLRGQVPDDLFERPNAYDPNKPKQGHPRRPGRKPPIGEAGG